MHIRFISRRTLLTLISSLVVVSIVVGAAWPAGVTIRADSRPLRGVPSPVSQEGMPMSAASAPTPATINGLEVLLGEGAAQPQPPTLS